MPKPEVHILAPKLMCRTVEDPGLRRSHAAVRANLSPGQAFKGFRELGRRQFTHEIAPEPEEVGARSHRVWPTPEFWYTHAETLQRAVGPLSPALRTLYYAAVEERAALEAPDNSSDVPPVAELNR